MCNKPPTQTLGLSRLRHELVMSRYERRVTTQMQDVTNSSRTEEGHLALGQASQRQRKRL